MSSSSVSMDQYHPSSVGIDASRANDRRNSTRLVRPRSWRRRRRGLSSGQPPRNSRRAVDVPLPWPGKGLVEVVDIEDQPALGCPETSEVHEMAVPAQLNHDAGVRCVRQIRSHHRRRTSEEAERRLRHPAVADRQQVLDAALALRNQHPDRIRSIRRRLPNLRAPSAARRRGALGPTPAARRDRRLPSAALRRCAASSARANAATLRSPTAATSLTRSSSTLKPRGASFSSISRNPRFRRTNTWM